MIKYWRKCRFPGCDGNCGNKEQVTISFADLVICGVAIVFVVGCLMAVLP